MTLSERQRIFSKNVAKLILWAAENGIEVVIGEVQRTLDQQRLYVRAGKSRTMDSKHLLKLAVDFALFVDGKYTVAREPHAKMGAYWKSLHPCNVWGGDFAKLQDLVHFEYNPALEGK